MKRRQTDEYEMDEPAIDIASYIDHTVLSPTATDRDMARGCELARQFGTAAVFVKPHFAIEAGRMLAGSRVKLGVPVGFPQGQSLPRVKAAEAEAAIDMGAGEIDMVVNIGKVLDEDWRYVSEDIAAVAEVVHAQNMVIKVIFETCYLADSHKIRLCEICEDIGVDFAKTSTGMGTGGATPADVALMLGNLRRVKVKAAGGIRTRAQALEMLRLGAARIGTSSTTQILTDIQRGP